MLARNNIRAAVVAEVSHTIAAEAKVNPSFAERVLELALPEDLCMAVDLQSQVAVNPSMPVRKPSRQGRDQRRPWTLRAAV